MDPLNDIPWMLPRTLFNEDHAAFRETVRRFFAEEVVPHRERFEAQQHVDRDLWLKAGALGMLCPTIPEVYGGSGVDRRYSMILMEEQAYAGDSGCGFALHSDIVANYLLNFGSEAQKQQWLPRMASGEVVAAIAMTEPGTGSDLQNVQTKAVRDGDSYILNGSKIFITNGYLSDLVIVVARTNSEKPGSAALSLFLVDTRLPGFSKGNPLKKVGMKAQDTCELFFNDVRVPADQLLGHEGMGFVMLMQELAWERLMIAIMCTAGAEFAYAETLQYVRDRKVFGKPVASFQNSRFQLAEIKSEIQIGRIFVDRCMQQILEGSLSIDAAAASKYWCSDLLCKVVDACVQLHGGYGYMLDYPIARAWIDMRANRIYGGTNEIMKEIIARML